MATGDSIVGKGGRAYLIVKRLFDVICSLLAIIILSPVLLVVAIIVKVTSPGPVIYRQHRVGMHGRDIYLYKFRSMVENADRLIDSFTPEQKKEYYENFKLEHDPRVTGIGRFLRKSSIDELPQLVNIFKGEMSFVGPRPIVEEELENYGTDRDLFLSVKPGLTGYWASNGRSNVSYKERMKMELFYVDHCCIRLDIQIIWNTIITVIKREGAK